LSVFVNLKPKYKTDRARGISSRYIHEAYVLLKLLRPIDRHEASHWPHCDTWASLFHNRARSLACKSPLFTHSWAELMRVTDRRTDRRTDGRTDGEATSIAKRLLRNARYCKIKKIKVVGQHCSRRSNS